jgi:hypothetical protein
MQLRILHCWSLYGNRIALLTAAGLHCRGRHFNIAARVNGPQRSVDSLTVMQIWSLKNETDNRSLHAKLISGLYEKPAALGVQASCRKQLARCADHAVFTKQ